MLFFQETCGQASVDEKQPAINPIKSNYCIFICNNSGFLPCSVLSHQCINRLNLYSCSAWHSFCMKREKAKMLKVIKLQQVSVGKRYQCKRKFIAVFDPMSADHCHLVYWERRGLFQERGPWIKVGWVCLHYNQQGNLKNWPFLLLPVHSICNQKVCWNHMLEFM